MSNLFSGEIGKRLKNMYGSGQETQFNQEAVLWKEIGTASDKAQGNGFYGNAMFSANERGSGAINELEALPVADSQVNDQYYIRPKVIVHKEKFSGLYEAMAEGGDASNFASGVTGDLDEGAKSGYKYMNQMLYRTGTGLLARVNGAVSASASVIVDNGVITHIKEGTFLDSYDASTNAVKQISGIKVNAVDYSTNTLTLASTQTTDDDAYLYKERVHDGAPTDGKEIAGLPAIFDDGSVVATYEGLSRTTYPMWKGLKIAVSATLSDAAMQRAKSQAFIYANATPKVIVSNTSQARAYIADTLPQVQFTGDVKKRDAGSDLMTMSWNGMKWIVDADAPFDELYMLNLDYIKKYQVKGFALDTKGGEIKIDDGYDASYAYFKAYLNVGTKSPRKAGVRLTGLTVPTF